MKEGLLIQSQQQFNYLIYLNVAEKEVGEIHTTGESQTTTAEDIVPEDDGK